VTACVVSRSWNRDEVRLECVAGVTECVVSRSWNRDDVRLE